MAKIDVINVLGKTVSKLELSDAVFAIDPHKQAMFDLVMVERASKRQGSHSTKTRDEVSGGGRKPWKQKGTGRARQGSIRSPQWKGGGVVFGPTPEKNYTLKINKKVKSLALKSGWSLKQMHKQLFILDKLQFDTPKTKDFFQLLKNLKIEKKKILLILNPEEKNSFAMLSGKNLKRVKIKIPQQVFLDDLLNSEAILTDTDTIKTIERGLN